MRFAIVLHGPEVLDTGLGQRVISLLKRKGEVKVVMSGYTGVAAVVDAGLEGEVNIARQRRPSVELAHRSHNADYLLLVNYAKSRESAINFGAIVHSRCKDRLTVPFIQVDDGILIDWSGKGGEIADFLTDELGLQIISKDTIPHGAEQPERDRRRISGIIPGENVWIDGVIIGRATSENVILSKGPDGRLKAEGMELKTTGVDRLGDFDLINAHVRSGLVRRTKAKARSIRSRRSGIFFIDHSAERAVYRCREASLVITVGDDTSKIAGSLLFRFGVPIIAITDGDEDGISLEALKTKGSVVIEVQPGTDDIVGKEVQRMIFQGKDRMEGTAPPIIMAQEVMRIAGGRLVGHKVYE